MNMFKKSFVVKSLSIVLVLLLIISLTGCKPSGSSDSNSSGEEAKKETQFLSIAANPIGQAAYQWAAGISDLINKSNSNINATAEETKGYMENVRLLVDGEVELGFSNSILLNEAYYGEGSFEQNDAEKVLAVMSISPITMHIMTLEGSSVKSVDDFKGKRVGLGQIGGSSLIDALRLIEALGYEESDFEGFKVNLAEQLDMLKNGQLDVAIWNGSVPLPAVTELATTKDVTFLPIPDEVSGKIIEEFPSYFDKDLEANTYPKQTEKINSYSLTNVLMANAEVSEEVVYMVTKLIMENLEELVSIHPSFGFLSPESVLEGLTVPLHPGALKYYKEANIPGIEEYEQKYK